eukprot:TRINITY_DN28257_c0_g1_i1.p1 TRINITY_DN28257_c0_g1~~TRINITY_DN28257_c0_g1_i1.p1  ORF type:complete len:196 (+),score=47.66 TRINITY_DN28257_c0_g1_i1:221-808(+)
MDNAFKPARKEEEKVAKKAGLKIDRKHSREEVPHSSSKLSTRAKLESTPLQATSITVPEPSPSSLHQYSFTPPTFSSPIPSHTTSFHVPLHPPTTIASPTSFPHLTDIASPTSPFPMPPHVFSSFSPAPSTTFPTMTSPSSFFPSSFTSPTSPYRMPSCTTFSSPSASSLSFPKQPASLTSLQTSPSPSITNAKK